MCQKARRGRQRVAVFLKHESCPEVDGVTYMPGVYKIPMVRMTERSDEPANVRVYRHDCIEMCRGKKLQSVWFSKNMRYEQPCCVTGASKLTGL